MTNQEQSPTASPEKDIAKFNQFEQVNYSNGVEHVYGIDPESGKKVHLSHNAVLEAYGYDSKASTEIPPTNDNDLDDGDSEIPESKEPAGIEPVSLPEPIETDNLDEEDDELTDEQKRRRDEFWRNVNENQNNENDHTNDANEADTTEEPSRGLVRRAWERAQVVVGNIATGNVRRRNVIIGAIAGLVTAVGIQKLTGDHESVRHVAHGAIAPDSTLAVHDGQGFADALRENGFQHPHHIINNLSNSGVMDGNGPLADRLVGNPDNPHGMHIENFVDQRGAEGRMWVGEDLSSVLPDRTVVETSNGIGPVEAGAIGAVVGGVGAGLAIRSGENNARREQQENSHVQINNEPALGEVDDTYVSSLEHDREEGILQNQRLIAQLEAQRAYIEELEQELRDRVLSENEDVEDEDDENNY